MSLVEFAKGFGTSFTIRREFPELNRLALGLLVGTSFSHVKKHRSIIDGFPLPKTGALILTGNHTDETDNNKLCIAGVEAGRLIRPVLKKGLVVKGFSESEAFLKSIEAQESLPYKATVAFVLRGVGAIAVDREHLDLMLFMKQTGQVLKTEQILGLFLQPHRYEDGGLRYLQVGAAVLAKRHPNMPVVLFATSTEPDKLTFFPPTTFSEIEAEHERKLTAQEGTIIFADRVSSRLPKRPREQWLDEQKVIEAERLKVSLRDLKLAA